MTTTTFQLTAQPRKVFGRKVKSLRRAGLIPANVFGPKTKSKALILDKKEFLQLFKSAGETNLVDLVVKGEKNPRKVLISHLQTHPVTNDILHVDLHQVDLKSKTTASVPIVLTGQAPAASKGGVVVLALKEVEVEALPTDLPSHIEVDISSLVEIGDSILIKDLKIDTSKVSLLADPQEIVVSIQAHTEEEPEEPSSSEEVAEQPSSDEQSSSDNKPSSPDNQDSQQA